MRKLSLTLGLLMMLLQVWAQQNPHGKDFILNCADCHTSEGWKYTATPLFNHNSTNFKLEGQHNYINCRDCHTSLVFSEAKTNCSDCHTDMHNTTVGMDCARCHTPKSWIVSNITQIHQQSRFPLLGAHNTADCAACHTSASQLDFHPLGIDCVDCHKKEYDATTKPNHQQTGMSTNCIECHKIDAFEWSSSGYNHDFFPLTLGHKVENCADCHKSGLNEPISAECNSCHQSDFTSASNPKHKQPDFSTTCTECHTTNPDWKPAKFDIHDASYFPIYSGEHKGEWESCSECHTQNENYAVFSCTNCHEHNKSDMDKEHREENGYSYNSSACYACHPTGNKEGSFNHSTTDFPLKGAHTQTDCLSCHTNGFSGTSMACSSCHTKDYQEAAKPVHTTAGISTECETCHNETSWAPSNFDHTTTTGFGLTGGHSGKQCAECHTGNTTSASSECVSCHQANYNEAPNHVSQKFPTNCLQCHNTNNWEETTFNHNNTAFPLVGAHIATECAACHTSGYAGTPMQCNACHTSNYNEAQNPNHTNAGISTQCETCHTPVAWIPSQFDHTATSGFALTGGHSGKQCAECHTGNTTSASSECVSCHQANYNEAPNHVSQKFPTNCLQCHNTNNWEETTFNHNNTAFPLVGAHIATECAACHTAGYAGTPTQCNACHTNDYNEAQNPNHTTAGISTECQTCHTPANWIPSQFDHAATTGFGLTGGHSGKQCAECHTGNTTSASSECVSCHQANYNEAPEHVSQKFPTNCTECHNTNNWEENTFNHNNTAFPLVGAHIATECAACHTAGYAGTPTQCNACHTANYNEAQNPNHTNAGISTQCETCHTPVAWIPSQFDHTATSGFALTGGHSGKQCAECHTGNTTSASSECISCHQANYNEAPEHVSQKFPTNCLQCHNTNNWEENTFNHNNSSFPLVGAHIATECAACHTSGYAGTPMQCNACHTANYNEAQNPNHTNAGISTECQTCHTPANWIPSQFDHAATTGFSLTGGHSGKQCAECHTGNTTSASSECVSCHQANYNEAPNHVSQKFPTNCLECHSTNNWEENTFNHNNTAFPLVGAHIATECAACHTTGYAGTPTQCNACHTNNYNEAQNPNHTSLGLSSNCNDCHTTNLGWEPALFPNHQDYYALHGAHSAIATNCNLCHAGSYTNTPITCYGCHTSDYNATTNPAHSTAQFPTDCQSCHTETAWEPSTFNHDSQYFPIYSGKHQGEWSKCTDCHTQPTNYSVFSCIDCHEHNKTDMDNEHRGENGYVYNSANCYACHPKGDS